MRSYLDLVSISIRSKMQYRSSFLMLTLSYFLSTFTDFLGIWILMDRFKTIQGWTLPEICLLYGVVQTAFSLAETFARGFDMLSQYIKQGDFDRFLLKPLHPFIQLAAEEVQPMRLGRFFQGLLVLLWGAITLHISLSLSLILFLSIIGTALLFYALFVMQATLAFWTTETLELANVLTYGGLEVSQYPLSIYKFWFRQFFTFIVPLGLTAYYPVYTSLPWMGLISPLIGGLLLFMSYLFFNQGIKRYQSTGS